MIQDLVKYLLNIFDVLRYCVIDFIFVDAQVRMFCFDQTIFHILYFKLCKADNYFICEQQFEVMTAQFIVYTTFTLNFYYIYYTCTN